MNGHATNGLTYPPPPYNPFIANRYWRGGKLFPHPFSEKKSRGFATRNIGVLPDLLGFPFVCIFLIPALVACGGGGGAGPGISSNSESAGTSSLSHMANLSHIDWLVSPSVARMSVTPDAPALPITSAQGISKINAIAAKSNEIYASRVWYKPQGGTAVHSRYDCEGGSCHNLRENGAPDYGLHDKNGLNLYHTAIELQPVMSHNGVSIGQIRATSRESEIQLYGGWMESGAFFVRWVNNLSSDHVVAFPHSFGYAPYPRNNPQDLSSSGLSGTWTGAVVGIRYGSGKEGNVVHGAAEVSIDDFTNATMDVSFTGLFDLNASESIADINWSNLSIVSGEFSSVGSSPYSEIRGQFYGTDHKEVSGTFDRNSIIGAFGAIRGKSSN